MKFAARKCSAQRRDVDASGARASARFCAVADAALEELSAPTFGAMKRRKRRAPEAAFTLAEVLAALLFMAIVIPVALQGLRIASRAGEFAERKREAARVAEKILNESIVTTNWNSAALSGTIYEANREYNWTLRTESWTEASTATALQRLTVDVEYPVQGEKFSVEMSTLANSQ